jgi:hypothetical protein
MTSRACRYSIAVAENRADRGNIVANTLLPFLGREEDMPASRPNDGLAKRQRQVLFGWYVTSLSIFRANGSRLAFEQAVNPYD